MKQDERPNFRNKRAVVSGPLTDLGKNIVVELCKQGANVIALGGQEAELAALKNTFPFIKIIPADLTDWKGTEKALEEVGAVDFLVNCGEYNAIANVVDVKEEDVDKILNINLKGLFALFFSSFWW